MGSFVRLFTGPDGESHLEEKDMGFGSSDFSHLGGFSPAVAAAPVHLIPERVKAVIIGSQTDMNLEGLHRVRQRHYIVFISGAAEMETSDGTKRIFRAGDFLEEDDRAGGGHKWVLLEKPWEWLAVMLEDEDQ